MRVDLSHLAKTVTIVNRIKGKPDRYEVRVLEAQWNVVTEALAGDTTLQISPRFKIQLPKEGYVPYSEFTGGPSTYTCSLGDYIVLGDASEALEAGIRANKLRDTLSTLEPNVCNVQSIADKTESGMGGVRFLEFIYVEGV